MIVLVLGIAQVPALIITLPAIGYIWWTGTYGTVEAIIYSALIFVSGMADNVLKPLMLGRGVDAPMPVILIGALGGMAAKGILGMFVGATLLALGYQIFMGWVVARAEAKASGQEQTKATRPRRLVITKPKSPQTVAQRRTRPRTSDSGGASAAPDIHRHQKSRLTLTFSRALRRCA